MQQEVSNNNTSTNTQPNFSITSNSNNKNSQGRMEEPNNYDDDVDAFFAGFVAGGGFVADGNAAVNNNEAAAGANEEDEEDEDANDDDDNEDTNDEDDQMAIQKLFWVVQQRDDFPIRQRNKIIELAHQFVNDLGADIKEMVTDQRTVADGYDGLDSNRDTQQEVETALRHYPETLSERGGRYNRLNWYPIQCITIIDDRVNRKWICNPMAVSFVVLFAKLAIEFNSFDEEARGGLLMTRVGDLDVLNRLVQSSHRFCDEGYHQHVDTKFLEVLVQLRRSGLFEKEDIQRYHLVRWLCKEAGYFAEKRFHFLTNWDPSSLVQLGDHGELPLHYSHFTQTIQQVQVMLNTHFRYFTKEKVICLLFQEATDGATPFQLVCKFLHKHKTDTLVHDVVEQSLGTARFSSTTTTTSSSSSSSLNIGTALMIATRNDNISLDGWYYFIRRQPDTMLSMLRHRRRCDDTASVLLSSSPSSNNKNNKNTDISNQNTGISNSSNSNTNTGINDDGTSIGRTSTNNTNNDDDTTLHNNNNDDVVVRRRTTRKRKQHS